MQLSFTAGTVLRAFWMIARRVHSLPRLCVPKFPKNVIVGAFTWTAT